MSDVFSSFAADVAPTLVLIDVLGRKNSVAHAGNIREALVAADRLQAMSGAEKISTFPKASGNDEGLSLDKAAPFLLYYRSHQGRPSRAEIARAARVIHGSQIRAANHVEGETCYATGTRALAYPASAVIGSNAVPFIISRTIWFNHNRAIREFPGSVRQVELLLADINSRLTEGEVSAPR